MCFISPGFQGLATTAKDRGYCTSTARAPRIWVGDSKGHCYVTEWMSVVIRRVVPVGGVLLFRRTSHPILSISHYFLVPNRERSRGGRGRRRRSCCSWRCSNTRGKVEVSPAVLPDGAVGVGSGRTVIKAGSICFSPNRVSLSSEKSVGLKWEMR